MGKKISSRAMKRKMKEIEEAAKNEALADKAFEAWTSDEVVERIGVASQGCFCLARDFKIEYDRSVFLFKGE